MLKSIIFKDKRFKTEDDYNYFGNLTSNTIVICNNYALMNTLAKEILDTVNGKAEYNDYDCDDNDVGNAKLVLSFGLQRVIEINKQKITIALEPAIVYKAKEIEDVWFFDYQEEIEEIELPHKEYIYPLTIFKGCKEIWMSGRDEVYKWVCNGRFGAYDGKWVNICAQK